MGFAVLVGFVDARVDAAVVLLTVALRAVALRGMARRATEAEAFAVPPFSELRVIAIASRALPLVAVASRARVPPPLRVDSLGGGKRTSSDMAGATGRYAGGARSWLGTNDDTK